MLKPAKKGGFIAERSESAGKKCDFTASSGNSSLLLPHLPLQLHTEQAELGFLARVWGGNAELRDYLAKNRLKYDNLA